MQEEIFEEATLFKCATLEQQDLIWFDWKIDPKLSCMFGEQYWA